MEIFRQHEDPSRKDGEEARARYVQRGAELPDRVAEEFRVPRGNRTLVEDSIFEVRIDAPALSLSSRFSIEVARRFSAPYVVAIEYPARFVFELAKGDFRPEVSGIRSAHLAPVTYGAPIGLEVPDQSPVPFRKRLSYSIESEWRVLLSIPEALPLQRYLVSMASLRYYAVLRRFNQL